MVTSVLQVSNLIDVIEDIEEDPEAGLILSSFEGMWCFGTCIGWRTVG